jgi:gluconokinase
MTSVLAVDIGSSSVRARVYDGEGRHIEGMEARQRYKVTRGRDGSAEFDADELLAAVERAIDEVRREAGGERLAAVGASCFWHSLMALDRRGRAATPLITWGDTRAVDAAEELARRLDPDAVHARTGCPLHPSFWPAKLLWLRRRDPPLFASARRFVSFSDYVLARLTRELTTSLSMASATGLVDVNRACWDEELLETLELSPERLPEISDEPVGADEPWFPALGDGACSNIGIGCTRREQAALAVGTSAAYRIVYEAERGRPRPGLFLLRLDGRRFVEGGSLSDGGNLYTWLEETLRLPDGWSVAGDGPAPHGLAFLPLLGGERSPGWNGRARGAVAGLSFDTSSDELAEAALEGVCYRFADVAELLPEVRDVVASGHALQRNPAWVQMLADVLERPVALSAVDEASARGAAVLTLERLGHAAEDAPLGEVFLPREDRSEAFRAARERQRELYRRLFSS